MSEPPRRLGKSEVMVSALGVGVWSWGDRVFWGYGRTYSKADVQAAYRASLEAGITFFDTAEIYGRGASERLLGEFVRADGRPVVIASKFAPLPFRLSAARALPAALDRSLARLRQDKVDLYQIHWPYSLLSVESLMDALAEVVKAGKVRAVGVSNYTTDQMRQAQACLARYDIPLASNQVQYNLLKRTPEANGVLQTCRELDIALIAYSPLAQGLLTGKYANGPTPKPKGFRAFTQFFGSNDQPETRAILDTVAEIARSRQKTSEQVALNWLLCRDELVIPIPGAKTARQASSNAGAIGWRLSEEEVARLDRVSASRVR